jgi:atypical dual specificity phosphatase
MMGDLLTPRALWRQISGWIRAPWFTWVVDGSIAACRYPRTDADLQALADRGIAALLNLHEEAHDAEQLRRFRLTEAHVPVRDFTAPSPEQIAAGVAAVRGAIERGQRIAVHCGAGLGRTGTMLACYFVSTGMSAEAAIERVRLVRPGSIETRRQRVAVRRYAASLSRDAG